MSSGGVIFHGIKASELSPKAARPGFELWGVTRSNSKYWKGALTDWDRWFDKHSFEPMSRWPGLEANDPATLAWYQLEPAGGRPIYMQRHDPRVPASVPYPLAEIQAAFPIDEGNGPEPNRMFGCMVDYLFALALFEQKDPIVLNGVGMSHDAQHGYLHRTILGWMQFARGRGVQVIVEGPSCYRNAGRQLYGYERYGYEELDRLMATFTSAPNPAIEPFDALIQSWRVESRTSTQCANELDHVLAVLQRMRNREAA